MRPLFVGLTVVAALTLMGCGCPPVPCIERTVVTLVDAAGQPASPASGRVTVGTSVEAFSCAATGASDGGTATVTTVACGPSSVTVPTIGSFQLEVVDTQGRRFVGPVTPTFPGASPVAPLGCQCAGQPGSATVTVRP